MRNLVPILTIAALLGAASCATPSQSRTLTATGVVLNLLGTTVVVASAASEKQPMGGIAAGSVTAAFGTVMAWAGVVSYMNTDIPRSTRVCVEGGDGAWECEDDPYRPPEPDPLVRPGTPF